MRIGLQFFFLFWQKLQNIIEIIKRAKPRASFLPTRRAARGTQRVRPRGLDGVGVGCAARALSQRGAGRRGRPLAGPSLSGLVWVSLLTTQRRQERQGAFAIAAWARCRGPVQGRTCRRVTPRHPREVTVRFPSVRLSYTEKNHSIQIQSESLHPGDLGDRAAVRRRDVNSAGRSRGETHDGS